MLELIASDQSWLGDANYIDASLVDGAKREILQPTANATSHRWYTVVMGTDVGIFTSWFVWSVFL
jgi:hypothetical protein